MSKIWSNLLLPKTLKSCPKSNKSPDLVTLHPTYLNRFFVQGMILLTILSKKLKGHLTFSFQKVYYIKYSYFQCPYWSRYCRQNLRVCEAVVVILFWVMGSNFSATSERKDKINELLKNIYL